MSETLNEQTARMLQAFMDSPGHKMTTGEIHSLPFLVNPTARVSDLRKRGHVIEVEPIHGTRSSMYYWKGLLGDATPPELKYLTKITLGGQTVEVWI